MSRPCGLLLLDGIRCNYPDGHKDGHGVIEPEANVSKCECKIKREWFDCGQEERLRRIKEDEEPETYILSIEYCKLHAAAPEMVEILKTLRPVLLIANYDKTILMSAMIRDVTNILKRVGGLK